MEVTTVDERDMTEIIDKPMYRVIDWWLLPGSENRVRSKTFEIHEGEIWEVLTWVEKRDRTDCQISEIYTTFPGDRKNSLKCALIGTYRH